MEPHYRLIIAFFWGGGRVVLAMVVAISASVRGHLWCWAHVVTRSCYHDPFSHAGSTGSSGRKTDIPQTDPFVHLIIGSLICSKCPRWVYMGHRYPPTVCLFPEIHSPTCQKFYSGHCSSPLSLRATPEYVCNKGHPFLLVPGSHVDPSTNLVCHCLFFFN